MKAVKEGKKIFNSKQPFSYPEKNFRGSSYQDNLQPDQTNTTLGEIAQNRSQVSLDNNCLS
jgi:hypothetical protein